MRFTKPNKSIWFLCLEYWYWRGASLLQVIKAFKDINGVDVKYEFAPRRDGDIAICYADNQRAVSELGWIPQYGLEEMLRDSWNWQKQNPNGYN